MKMQHLLSLYYPDWCDTHEIESFGDAYTHRWTITQGGAWFKDPVPSSNASKTQLLTKVYGNARLLRYENYPDFLSTRNPNNLVQLNTHGVGYVLYNQSFYYSYTNNIYRQVTLVLNIYGTNPGKEFQKGELNTTIKTI